MNQNNFGKIMRRERELAGLSAEETCARLKYYGYDINKKTLYGYESGHRHPDADLFVALCDVYGTTDPLSVYGYQVGKTKEEQVYDDLVHEITRLGGINPDGSRNEEQMQRILLYLRSGGELIRRDSSEKA